VAVQPLALCAICNGSGYQQVWPYECDSCRGGEQRKNDDGCPAVVESMKLALSVAGRSEHCDEDGHAECESELPCHVEDAGAGRKSIRRENTCAGGNERWQSKAAAGSH
jgi:hypothetical protein